jgi:hypothetical protein
MLSREGWPTHVRGVSLKAMNPLGSRLSQVVHSEIAVPDACPADLHHPRALVKVGHLSPAADQLPGVQARPHAASRTRLPATSPSSARHAGRS